eukprot:TRINITY_DN4649_c0_g1_i3.p1 TRINITY_DN4649_c0_g1~~TRINITY_DN4649_c0_g1_i3.p1  ORF type:complete len:247 (-),score=56.74 TRINITY_DN4649_c0_g1_i3:56-796(-)
MHFTESRQFTMGISFHGGALVANYGYDGNANYADVYTATPDDAFFRFACLTYSTAHLTMHSSSEFSNGITNGAAWYVLYGGIQDYSYLWHDDFLFTMEIGDDKWPSASALPSLWAQNRPALAAFSKLALRCGISGHITDAGTMLPISGKIHVESINKTIANAADTGFYQRLLVPGTYVVYASAAGHASSDRVTVTVPTDQTAPVAVDFSLVPGADAASSFDDVSPAAAPFASAVALLLLAAVAAAL